MPYVQCAVLGYSSLFSIEIESDMLMVSDLVCEMKGAEPSTLGLFANSDLILYKVDIDPPNDAALDEILEAIYLGSVEHREDQKLRHSAKLSSVFGTAGPLACAINILVKPPTGESFDPRPQRRPRPVYPSLIVYHSLPYRPTSLHTRTFNLPFRGSYPHHTHDASPKGFCGAESI